MPGKHGPNWLRNYVEVHERWMANFLSEGFVIDDQCGFTFQQTAVVVGGDIVCLDGIVIQVDKQLDVLDSGTGNPRVRTGRFSYNARVRGRHNILRYDSPHVHRPQPHKHSYDTFGTGDETSVVDLVNESDVPTLGEVIRELEEWHQENAARLRR